MGVDATRFVVSDMALPDVPQVAALEQAVFTLPWSQHAFEYELQHNPMAHFLVLREAEQHARPDETTRPLLGYGGFWLIVDEAHICTLAIEPAWRGIGLGELLLLSLLDRAMAVQAIVATLEARISNTVARRLYEKYGFALVGARKGYYHDNHEDAVIMTTEPMDSQPFQNRLQHLRRALWQRLREGELTASSHHARMT